TGTISNGEFEFHKHAGKLKDLKEKLGDNTPKGNIGIAHSRWATHGISNELNSHPHVSNSGRLAIVHKGIVENYASLKEKLVEDGYQFKSETDTEVLINWIEHIQKEGDLNLLEAIQVAMNQVVGAYSLIVIDKEEN